MYRQNIPNYRRNPNYNPNYNPTWEGLQPGFPQFNRNHFLGPGGNARGGRNNVRLGNHEVQRGRTPCKEKWWAFVTNSIQWVNSPRGFNLDSEDKIKEVAPARPIFLAKAQAHCHFASSPRGRHNEQPNCGRQQAMAHPIPLENRSFASYYDGVYEFGETKLKESPLAQIERELVIEQKALTCPVSGPTFGLTDTSDVSFPDARKDLTSQDLANVMPCFRTGNDMHALLESSKEREREEADICNASESMPRSRCGGHSRTSPLFGSSINGIPDFLDSSSKGLKNDDRTGDGLSVRSEDKPNDEATTPVEGNELPHQDKKELHGLRSSYNLGHSFTYLDNDIEVGYTTIQAFQSAIDQATKNGLYEEVGKKPFMYSINDNELEHPYRGALGMSAPGNNTPSAPRLRCKSTMQEGKNLIHSGLHFQENKESFCGVPNYDLAGDFGYDRLQTSPQASKSLAPHVDDSSSPFPIHTERSSTIGSAPYTISGSFGPSPKATDLPCVQPPPIATNQEANENPLEGKHRNFGSGNGIHTQSLSTSSISSSDSRLKKRVDTALIAHPIVPVKDFAAPRCMDSKFTSTTGEIDEIIKPHAHKAGLLEKNIQPITVVAKAISEVPNIRGSLEVKPYSPLTREAVISKGNPNTSEAPRTKDYLAFITKLPPPSDNVRPRRSSAVEYRNSCSANVASGLKKGTHGSIAVTENKRKDCRNVTTPDAKDRSPDNVSKMPYSALLPVLLYEISKADRHFTESHKISASEEQINRPSMNIKSTQIPSPSMPKKESHSNIKETSKQTCKSLLLPAFRKENHSK